MNKTIFKYTIMSACLDPMKLIYVFMLGFVVPIGMKIASLVHGASDSQTFEMLTGKVGVAFILMAPSVSIRWRNARRYAGCAAALRTRSQPVILYSVTIWLRQTRAPADWMLVVTSGRAPSTVGS